MSDKLTWDNVPEEAEEFTEKDIKDSENSGKPPVGKYLVVVKASEPRQINPKDKPSFFSANLKMEIEEVFEIEKKPVNGAEGEAFVGRILWDGVRMFSEGEDEMWLHRRIRIAKAAGVISDSSTKLPRNMWSEVIVGKRFLVDNEPNTYTDKNGAVKNTTQIGLFGYHAPEDAIKVSSSDIDDI